MLFDLWSRFYDLPWVQRAVYRAPHVAPAPAARGVVERLLGALVSLGLTPASWPGSDCGTVLLEVRGRRTGRLRSTLVTWVEHGGGRYLVSMPGPDPGWVRNVRAAGEVILRHGRKRIFVCLEELPADRRSPVLQAWYRWTGRSPVPRRHFQLDRRAPIEQFDGIAARHPVFRIRSGHAEEEAGVARRVTRDVEPRAMGDLLANPPRATVAFVEGDRVELLPVRLSSHAGLHLFGASEASPRLEGREVVLLADGGAYWFELCGISVRGTVRPVDPPAMQRRDQLAWYAVDPRRVLAWDYDAVREE